MTHPTGRVLLVGAGPGPADLMTVRAQRTVKSAKALLYDAPVEPEVLALAPGPCLKLQTGKRANQASMSQYTLMLKLARRDLQVARLTTLLQPARNRIANRIPPTLLAAYPSSQRPSFFKPATPVRQG